MRQIVIEGPDGAGKTTMVNELMDKLGVDMHARACTSVGGPIDADGLGLWVMREFDREKPFGVYDRHPVISEPIYGSVIRGELRGEFRSDNWLREMRGKLATSSYVVFCLPPWSDVRANIDAGVHMPGVVEHAYTIYQLYLFTAKTWPGPSIVHDYTLGAPRRAYNIERILLMSGHR